MNNQSALTQTTSNPVVTAPTWQLVFKRELAELWLGGRALNLLVLFSVLVSITAFLLATNDNAKLATPDQNEVVLLQAAITFGLFIGLIIAAESISGERERATFEALMLTPISRRQIVVGKFLGAMSVWPPAMLVVLPFMILLSQKDPILIPSLIWGGILGSLLAVIFTGVGMLVSMMLNSNKNSLFLSMLIYLLSLLPSQMPGEVMNTAAGPFIRAAGPLEAANYFLETTLVGKQPFKEEWIYLVMPLILAILVLVVLFVYAAPRLHLEGGRASLTRPVRSQTEATND